MDEKMTVLELRKAKKEELKAVINRLKELEKENEATKHGPMEAHFGIAKEVDKLYLRRRTLKDFLKELDNGKQLIISAEKVMHFFWRGLKMYKDNDGVIWEENEDIGVIKVDPGYEGDWLI